MPTVHDTAAYILGKTGPISAMKLQKLVYYAQAWSLVIDEAPLFPERIEAWANGPVVRALYNLHRGQYFVTEWPTGNAAAFTPAQRETVDQVVAFYGQKSPQWLSDLTHLEEPWQQARASAGLAPGDRGEAEITLESMADYYGRLAAKKS
jgi:uncharacterized phage-associated protein